MGWLCHQALLVAFLGSKVLALEIPDGKPRWAVGSTPKLIPWPMARAAAQRLGFRHHDEVPLRARSTVSPTLPRATKHLLAASHHVIARLDVPVARVGGEQQTGHHVQVQLVDAG